MKLTLSRKVPITLLFLVVLFCLSNCKESEIPQAHKGKIQFSSKSSLGNRVKGNELNGLIVSIEKEDGTLVHEFKTLSLSQFGEGFLSETLQLEEGKYNLILFVITNSDGVAQYAAPIEGSPLAKYVLQPLPISFEVYKEQTTLINPEVIGIEEDMEPADFGLVQFGFNPIHLFSLKLGVYGFQNNTKSNLLSNVKIEGVGSTNGEESWSMDFPISIEIDTTLILLKSGFEFYNFSVTSDGFESQELQFTKDELVSKQYLEIILSAIASKPFFYRSNSIIYINGVATKEPEERVFFESYANGQQKSYYNQMDCCGSFGKRTYTYSSNNELNSILYNSTGNLVSVSRDENGKATDISNYWHTNLVDLFDIQLIYTDDKLTGATVKEKSNNAKVQTYEYYYSEDGRLTGFKSFIDGEVFREGELIFTDNPFVFFPTFYNDFFIKNTSHYSHLTLYPVLIAPLILGEIDNALVEFKITTYRTLYSKPTEVDNYDFRKFEYTGLGQDGKYSGLKVYGTNHPAYEFKLNREYFDLAY